MSSSLGGGGAERDASTLAANLDRRRFEVHLCLFRDDVTYPLPDDVPVHVVPKRGPASIPGCVRRLRTLLRSLRPDVVLGTMVPVGWLVVAARGSSLSNPRIVVRVVSSTKRRDSLLDVLATPLVWHYLRRADLLVPNAFALRSEVEPRLLGVRRPPAMEVVPNPCDISAIEARARSGVAASGFDRDDRPMVLFAGRLTKVKRPELLLEAFAEVLETHPSRLVLLGEGPLRASLEARSRELALTNSVTFAGFVDNPHAWMARADVFALTSDHEGLPNALIEAQALGVPAVSTRCPTGPDEIVEDGITGLLTPVGDAPALANALRSLLDDPERRASMGRAARIRARAHFSTDVVIRAWEDLLGGDPPESD